jgi:hypothetical protein
VCSTSKWLRKLSPQLIVSKSFAHCVGEFRYIADTRSSTTTALVLPSIISERESNAMLASCEAAVADCNAKPAGMSSTPCTARCVTLWSHADVAAIGALSAHLSKAMRMVRGRNHQCDAVTRCAVSSGSFGVSSSAIRAWHCVHEGFHERAPVPGGRTHVHGSCLADSPYVAAGSGRAERFAVGGRVPAGCARCIEHTSVVRCAHCSRRQCVCDRRAHMQLVLARRITRWFISLARRRCRHH